MQLENRTGRAFQAQLACWNDTHILLLILESVLAKVHHRLRFAIDHTS
jgi:hypothetical protein